MSLWQYDGQMSKKKLFLPKQRIFRSYTTQKFATFRVEIHNSLILIWFQKSVNNLLLLLLINDYPFRYTNIIKFYPTQIQAIYVY